uniref:Upf0548 protein n=1 Tax=Tetraselmis sp. GSL018 TaxID=582737 RepID=A0A061RK60_9CHLO|mmetsp:Transcript_33845/g.80345  ORF Transcript_33845/g.80345 Transcript_33845/m.80345 type:complete len:215 (+) Transcript_33845:87-731(+)
MVFLSLARPSKSQTDAAIDIGSRRGFNYEHVGSTYSAPPLPDKLRDQNWNVDHTRVKLGSGKMVYRRAKSAVQEWRHFQLGWTSVEPTTPILKDSKVCVVARALLVWTRNPLQIVYVREGNREVLSASAGPDGSPATTRAEVYSFAHGCLGGHLLAGEERFSVEWHKDDDSVWYEIYTFSKPAHLLSKATYPIVRGLQKKFGSDSAKAMMQEVS